MQSKHKFVSCALVAGVALGSMIQAASAGCPTSMAGVWHLHAIEAGQDVGGGAVQSCVANVASNGSFSAPCKIYEVGSGTAKSKTVTGTFKLSKTCDLIGSIAIGGGDAPITIRSGHVNGNAGGGIATQDTGANLQVVHFDLIKK
jgi:hypothetical protein